MGGGVGKVAAQRHFAAAAIGRAVDRTDDRDRAGDHRPHLAFEHQMLRLPLCVGHALALLKVAAGAECLVARAGEDDAAIGGRVGA